eukprot:jgi/Botrbrau1/18093/Bobra.0702s0003.1
MHGSPGISICGRHINYLVQSKNILDRAIRRLALLAPTLERMLRTAGPVSLRAVPSCCSPSRTLRLAPLSQVGLSGIQSKLHGGRLPTWSFRDPLRRYLQIGRLQSRPVACTSQRSRFASSREGQGVGAYLQSSAAFRANPDIQLTHSWNNVSFRLMP